MKKLVALTVLVLSCMFAPAQANAINETKPPLIGSLMLSTTLSKTWDVPKANTPSTEPVESRPLADPKRKDTWRFVAIFALAVSMGYMLGALLKPTSSSQ